MGRKPNIIPSPDQLPIDFEDPDFFDDSNLSPRQLAFCQHYAIHQNGLQAYLHAYYPGIKKTDEHYKKAYKTAGTNAYNLLDRTGIKEAIRRFLRQRAVKMQVSADYILHAARELVERGLGEKKPIIDPQTGIETGSYAYDPNAVAKGLAILIKHSSVSSEFTEKIEVTTNEKISSKLAKVQKSLRKDEQ